MRKRQRAREVQSTPVHPWMWIVVCLGLFICGGYALREYRSSQIVGSPYRHNIVAAGPTGDVTFLSFDPEEKHILSIHYPDTLEIKSRTVGSYRMDNLYKLGEYEGNPGEFTRRRVQGFMRVPITNFVPWKKESCEEAKTCLIRSLLSTGWWRLDHILLIKRALQYEWQNIGTSDLIKSQVLSETQGIYTYNQERLQQFLAAKVFDWHVGASNISVAIVNASSEDGLGRDIATFMENMGFEIVSVRSEKEQRESTLVRYAADKEDAIPLLQTFFGWETYEESNTENERAQFVVILGQDATSLF